MMLLIKISLLFSLLLPDSGKWQRIQTPECISFLFPNTPEKIVNTNNGIRYTLTNMFKSDKGPELHAYTVGIGVTF